MLKAKLRNSIGNLLGDLDSGKSIDSLANKIKKLDAMLVKMDILIQAMSAAPKGASISTAFTPLLEHYASDSLINDLIILIEKITKENLTELNLIPKITNILLQLESNIVWAKVKDPSLDLNELQLQKFSDRFEEALNCQNEIYENENYGDVED